MKTSKEWWESIKNDPSKIVEWLKVQYHGEWMAGKRILDFASQFAAGKNKEVLMIICAQEANHSIWIGDLLEARGVTPEVLSNKDERYWKETLPQIDSFESGAAVGAHAEEMRLERIRVIAADEAAPKDIVETFRKILKDEEFHAKAFRSMTTDEALEKANEAHIRGLEALGLVL